MILAECRDEVKAFAIAMERKLRENDHKKHWQSLTIDHLEKRLRQELAELKAEMDGVTLDLCDPNIDTEELPADNIEAIGRECVDVAAFAMMIADNVGYLEEFRIKRYT